MAWWGRPLTQGARGPHRWVISDELAGEPQSLKVERSEKYRRQVASCRLSPSHRAEQPYPNHPASNTLVSRYAGAISWATSGFPRTGEEVLDMMDGWDWIWGTLMMVVF